MSRQDPPAPNAHHSVGRTYWLDDPRNVNKIVYTLYAVCAGLVLLDLFYDKHPHFHFEEYFGFYGFYGLVGSIGLVLTSKLLRVLLNRKEDYYDATHRDDAS